MPRKGSYELSRKFTSRDSVACILEFSINSVTLVCLYVATEFSKLNSVLFGYINIGGKTIKKAGMTNTKYKVVVNSGWLLRGSRQRRMQLG